MRRSRERRACATVTRPRLTLSPAFCRASTGRAAADSDALGYMQLQLPPQLGGGAPLPHRAAAGSRGAARQPAAM